MSNINSDWVMRDVPGFSSARIVHISSARPLSSLAFKRPLARWRATRMRLQSLPLSADTRWERCRLKGRSCELDREIDRIAENLQKAVIAKWDVDDPSWLAKLEIETRRLDKRIIMIVNGVWKKSSSKVD